MKTLAVLALLCLVAAIAAKKAHKEEAESLSHASKKYAKEHQKPHHFNHKKHVPEEELTNEDEPRAKQAPVEVPEPDVELQGNLATSKKTVAEASQKEQLKDLHLQDLAYEESLQKEKRHHKAEADKKLFAEQEARHSVDEKVIEDSFEPLDPVEAKKSSKDKKHKEEKKRSKNKKAYEKSKDKNGKKQKDSKKNKDKKHKKDKKH